MDSEAGTQPRRTPAPQPREIGGYEILAPLGRGGMGVVYRARDPRTGEGVAVKTVLWAGEGALAAIRREIIALQAIRHPGVVKILGEGVLDGRPWYAMELLEGRSLRQRLAELWQPAATSHTTVDVRLTSVPPAPSAALPPPPRRRVHDTEPHPFAGAPSSSPAAPAELRPMLELVAAMCEPLAHVHAAGVVHRDLTPDNVIVRADAGPVLVDFGLAAAFRRGGREALSVAGTIVGTTHYMAPEQIRGEVVDARADLYSLGCILYEALTGRPPYLGASPAGILSMHLYDTPMPPSAREAIVPLWLDSLVLALLAKDPRDRIGYAGDVAALIRRALGEPAGAASPAYIYRPRLIGRADELARFDDTLERLRRGRGGVVLVRGQSGVGKTRLAVELATRASAEGMRVVTAECPPIAGGAGRAQARAAPLAPLKPFLQAVADRCLEHGAPEAARLLGERGRVLATYEPALGRLPGVAAAPAPAALTVEGTRARLFQYLRETLAAVADQAPLVLLVDDVQWADELTLRFFLSLRDDFFAHHPVMILATQRSEEDHPLVAELAGGATTDVIDLHQLDNDGVRAMVADMLALPEVPAVLVESLVGQSDGVPFHVGEYLRAAVEDGILTRRPGSVWSIGATDARLPTSLAELLHHRLERLGAGGRTLAALAAVLGREFDAELLADLTGAPAAVIDDAVRDMVRRHIFEEAAEGKLRFGHDKIREAAYGELGAEARKRAHRDAARALEHRASSQPSHDLYPVLAHHWSMADEPSKAVEFLEKAGARALEVGGYQDAVDFLRRALVLAERSGGVDPRRRGRWYRWLGEASWGLGDIDGRGEHYAAALNELDRPLPTTAGGWAADAGRRLVGQVLGRPRASSGDPDAAEAALAASRLSYRYYHAGDNVSMVAMILRAVDLADRADPAAKVAHAYQQLGYLAGLFRFPRVAERYFARSHHKAVATGDPTNVGVTLYTKAIYLLGDGRLGEAQRLCDESVRLLRDIDNPQEVECALAALVHTEHCLGRFGEAIARAQELYESARARNNLMHESWGAYTMARELLALGIVDDAVALLAHAEPLAVGAGDKASLVILLGLRALAEARRGHHAECRQIIDRWIELNRGATPTVYSLGHGYAAVAEAALDLLERAAEPADLARARATVAHAWRYAALFPVGRAAALILEARAQRLRGRRRVAVRLARAALDRATGAPLPYEAALAHHELAACAVRDGVDHAAEAAALLGRIGHAVR